MKEDNQEKNGDEGKKESSKSKKKKQQFKTTDLPIDSRVPCLSYSELQTLIEKEVCIIG